MKTYYFIRHGASESDVGNSRMRDFHDEMHTWVDWPLSASGRRQAVRAGRKLRQLGVQRVVSSTLSRTVETAELAAREAAVPYEGGWQALNEVVMGGLPGRPLPTGRAGPRAGAFRRLRRPLWPLFYRGMTIAYLLLWQMGKTRGGETREQVEDRAREVLRLLDDLPDQRIAVVGHGYWILFLARMLRRAAGRRPPVPPGGWVANVSFTKVSVPGGGHALEYFAVPVEKVTD